MILECKSVLTCFLATLLWGTLSVQSASAARALVADFRTSDIWDIDLATGAVSNPRSTGITFLSGIEFDSSGNLYGLSGDLGSGAIYSIDSATGHAVLIGDLGLNEVIEGGLAWDAASSTMYGVQDTPGIMRLLFTIDLITGLAQVVGNVTNVDDLSAISFDRDGNLYVLQTSDNVLLTIDKTNGNILSTRPLSRNIEAAAGMDYDPVNGTMYVVDGPPSTGSDNLYTLNLSTGDLTLIGSTLTSGRLSGIAIVPEPSLICQLVVGVAVLLVRGRVRTYGKR